MTEKKKPERRIEVVWITPDLAKKWLTLNRQNFRKLDKNRIDRYRKDLLEDNWHFTGEAIQFTYDSKTYEEYLANGANRLTAIAQSGKTAEVLVVWGITEESVIAMDSGKPRTVSQWLSFFNYSQSKGVAAIAKLSFMHELGKWKVQRGGGTFFTPQQHIQFCHDHRDALIGAAILSHNNIVAQSILGSVLFLGAGKQEPRENETCVWFANSLKNGRDIDEQDAVYWFRERLIREKPQKGMSDFLKRMVLTLAWNRTVQNKPTSASTLSLRLTGPRKTTYPDKVLVAGEEEEQ